MSTTDKLTGVTKRLNWGCGTHPVPDWINSDIKDDPGIDIVGDIRDGLPINDGELDYIVSIHALPMIPYQEIVPVLAELRRMLRPGGTLRLGLPDFDKAVSAYLQGDRTHFMVPDEDEPTLSGKLIVHLLWYGYSVSLFTEEFARGLLLRAGFSTVNLCRYQETSSTHEEIVDLDNREHETFFIEAKK